MHLMSWWEKYVRYEQTVKKTRKIFGIFYKIQKHPCILWTVVL